MRPGAAISRFAQPGDADLGRDLSAARLGQRRTVAREAPAAAVEVLQRLHPPQRGLGGGDLEHRRAGAAAGQRAVALRRVQARERGLARRAVEAQPAVVRPEGLGARRRPRATRATTAGSAIASRPRVRPQHHRGQQHDAVPGGVRRRALEQDRGEDRVRDDDQRRDQRRPGPRVDSIARDDPRHAEREQRGRERPRVVEQPRAVRASRSCSARRAATPPVPPSSRGRSDASGPRPSSSDAGTHAASSADPTRAEIAARPRDTRPRRSAPTTAARCRAPATSRRCPPRPAAVRAPRRRSQRRPRRGLASRHGRHRTLEAPCAALVACAPLPVAERDDAGRQLAAAVERGGGARGADVQRRRGRRAPSAPRPCPARAPASRRCIAGQRADVVERGRHAVAGQQHAAAAGAREREHEARGGAGDPVERRPSAPTVSTTTSGSRSRPLVKWRSCRSPPRAALAQCTRLIGVPGVYGRSPSGSGSPATSRRRDAVVAGGAAGAGRTSSDSGAPPCGQRARTGRGRRAAAAATGRARARPGGRSRTARSPRPAVERRATRRPAPSTSTRTGQPAQAADARSAA